MPDSAQDKKERVCTYVVERDDAVLGNEGTHLQLVGAHRRPGAAAAEGVRREGQVVCKKDSFDILRSIRYFDDLGDKEGAK